MLRSERMQKIRLVSLQEDRQKVVNAMHSLGVVDMRKIDGVQLGDDSPAQTLNQLSDALIRVGGALQIITGKEKRHWRHEIVPSQRHMQPERLVEHVRGMKALDRIYELSERRRLLNEELAALAYATRVAELFASSSVNFSMLKSNVLAFRAFELMPKDLPRLKAALANAKARAELVVSQGKKSAGVLVAYDRAQSIDDAIKGMRLREIDLGAKFVEGKPSDIIKRCGEARGRDEHEIASIGAELARIKAEHYVEIASAKEMLEIEVARANASGMFKKTESTFIAEGWLPKRKMAEFEGVIKSATNGRYFIEEVKTKELAPTLLTRPKFLKPFDYMMEFYSVPRSDEIDPTWIFIIFFPIFYGLMVSDVGYGIASLIFVTIITKITNPDGLVYNASKIWQLTSISAIIFGFLSNQYFGFQLNQYFTAFTGFSWLKDATTIIGISILFGILQVCLGLFFGFVNEYHHGKKLLAISKLTGIATIAFGTVAVASGFFGLLSPSLAMPTAIVAVIALIATGAMSGIEASELTNLITHPLSYARLMGFGLGSVIIAMLIDMAFTPTLSHGILVFVVLLIVFITLHFLNMILAIFEGIVQGIRLNFVEFFSKFYIGGGIKFKPFAYKRVYTKE